MQPRTAEGRTAGAEGACEGDRRLYERALEARCKALAVPLPVSLQGCPLELSWSMLTI